MTRSRSTLAAALLLLAAAPLVLLAGSDKAPKTEAPAKEKDGLPLLFHEDFKDGEKAMARFEFLDPSDWKIAKDGDRTVLSLFRKPTEASAGNPPVRRPFGQALVKDLYVGPFVMEVKLRSTIKPYGHQDLCLFFGQVDVSHGYYAHLGKEPDPNAGNVFIVNGAPRKNLLPALPKERGVPWTDGWHTARVVRGEDGAIRYFFDRTS